MFILNSYLLPLPSKEQSSEDEHEDDEDDGKDHSGDDGDSLLQDFAALHGTSEVTGSK